MKTYTRARNYLLEHPAYLVATGLVLAAAGQAIAGQRSAALQSLSTAAGVLGVRLAIAKPDMKS